MRILHLCSYSLYSGPIPSTLGLALAQRRLGHTVSVAYDVKRGAFNDFEEAAAPWIDPHALTPPVALTLSAKSTPLEWLRDVRALRQLLVRRELDVVHAHLSHDHGIAALASLRTPVPLVRTLHAERSLRPRFGQAWLHRQASGFILRCAAHERQFSNRFRLPAERVRVIEGSIDAERFVPATSEARREARRSFDLPPDAPVVCHVALMAGRGQEELVQAAARLGRRMPHLLFVGRGEKEARLRALVDTAGIGARVRFTGYLRGDSLLAAYAAADLAFLATPGNDASMRAALEAMACGLPLLAVTEGALAELCTEEVGFPVAERDPEAIALVLHEWLDACGDAHTRGRAARDFVARERTFDREAKRTLALYTDTLNRSRF